MPPCLCWRRSECCSWVNNVFSNQLILLQAVVQAKVWSNQSQPVEPVFCKLLTLSHKINCECKESEHPAEDTLETALRRTALGQRSRCFSPQSCRTAEIHGGWSPSLPTPQGCSTLKQHMDEKAALKNHLCSARALPRMLLRIKDLRKDQGNSKTVISSGLLFVHVQNFVQAHPHPTSESADQGSASQ